MTFEEFFDFLMSEECFNKCAVSFINNKGEQQYVEHDNLFAYQGRVVDLWFSGDDTIKVENYERIQPYDGTIHIFYAPVDAPSFPVHTDPIDIYIECLDGCKIMEIDDKYVVIEKGTKVFIPAETPHIALNSEKALTFSYGVNDTETLSYLRKDY